MNPVTSELGRSKLSQSASKKNILVQALSNRIFKLIVLPTEQCNFRCTYCYEDFVIGRMKEETITGIKAFLNKRICDLDHLNIEWFGGEPLVAKDIILDISKYATELARRYPESYYEGSMTTNGYLLTPSLAADLADVGVRGYQISLDGPREIHNKSRIRADRKETFDTIWSNLQGIANSLLPVSILLRLHFTVDNLELLDPLIKNLRNEFLPDPRFSFMFKAIHRLGGSNDDAIKIFSKDEEKKAINLLKAKLYGENRENIKEISKRSYIEPPDICYAARANSLIVRANGDVAKCTVALNDVRNKIGFLRPDGTLELIPKRLTPWLRGLKTFDLDTLHCPLGGLPPVDENMATLSES